MNASYILVRNISSKFGGLTVPVHFLCTSSVMLFRTFSPAHTLQSSQNVSVE